MKRAATRLAILLLLTVLLSFAVVAIVNETGSLNVAVNQNNTITVIFSNPTNPTSGGGTGGGAGGGGGGGDTGDANPCLEPNPSTSHTYDKIESGKEYSITSLTNQFFISKILFKAYSSVDDTTSFTLSHIKLLECETIPPLTTTAFGYERVSYPTTIKTGDVTITFKLLKSAITDKNTTPEDVRLYRYSDNNWNELETKIVSEDGSYVTFTASSPGLSYFSVGSKTTMTTTPTETPTTPTGDVTGTGSSGGTTEGGKKEGGTANNTGKDNNNQKGKRTGGKKHSSFSIISLLIVIILGGVFGLYYLLSKKAPKKEESDEETLKEYVEGELRRNVSREEIAKALRESGWSEETIKNALDNFSNSHLEQHGVHKAHNDFDKVRTFLKKKLELGYSGDVLKKNLVRVGWDAQLIDSLLKEQPLIKLRVFIEKELKRDIPKQELRDELLKAGWSEKVVDRELK